DCGVDAVAPTAPWDEWVEGVEGTELEAAGPLNTPTLKTPPGAPHLPLLSINLGSVVMAFHLVFGSILWVLVVLSQTVQNLKIGNDTRVIFQGFTGRQATQNAQQSLEWGTKIVGGVTPGRDGEHLGLPVLPNVKVAKEQLKPDATGIFVAAQFAAKAIEEAIEAEIPLIAAVAEHIPLHDILRISSMLATQSKSRFVGANSPGIISSIGRCRIGFQPLPTFSPGHVGIAAKSGTLSYEAVASLTRAGVGQSLCIGIGGDTVSGTSITDALKVFESDDDTHGIVLIGEIGGEAEIEAANWIAEYHRRTSTPNVRQKSLGNRRSVPGRFQSRSLIISSNAAKKMIHDKGYHASNSTSSNEKSAMIAVTISRARRCPCIYASPGSEWRETRSFPVNYGQGPDRQTLKALLEHTGFEMATSAFRIEFNTLINDLFHIFKSLEAVSLELVVTRSPSNDADHSGLHVIPERFVFDDAAINSAQRQTHLLEARDMTIPEYQPVELEASKHGIVYVKLTPEDPSANIGTLVNGAGLAMNTVDALAHRGGRPANFLDTGGKATAETVKKSFEAVLADERVKVIFVNIFGGLTLCNMIADGVMLAFKELGERMRVPVVVRLRGTNEEMGQKMIAESGLDLYAYDDFEEAAAKVIELAKANN
ncbi:MAG: hypothetical protein Q9157_002875, partial [Trypethelium eluteriae]